MEGLEAPGRVRLPYACGGNWLIPMASHACWMSSIMGVRLLPGSRCFARPWGWPRLRNQWLVVLVRLWISCALCSQGACCFFLSVDRKFLPACVCVCVVMEVTKAPFSLSPLFSCCWFSFVCLFRCSGIPCVGPILLLRPASCCAASARPSGPLVVVRSLSIRCAVLPVPTRAASI